jgi:hypothetical protein
LYVDGFRNIKETTLDFNEAIIVLLAPNNYGKSNLLLAIQNGFDLIAKQGTQVLKYIKDSDNYANYNIKNGTKRFSFGVEFTKSQTPNTLYRYQFALEYEMSEKCGKKISKSCGVSKEYLWRKTDNDVIYLFKREMNKDGSDITIVGGECSERTVTFIHDNIEKHSYFLGIHKLGNMAIFDDFDDDCVKSILKEISSVLRSLTYENTGNIIADEGSDYRSVGELSRDVIKMQKNDEHIKKSLNKNKCKGYRGEVGFFKDIFKKLFPYYSGDDGVELYPIGNTGVYQLSFKDIRKTKPETIKTLSFGTRRVFKLLSQIIANDTPLISIEEIEIGLHPELYEDVIKYLFDILDNNLYESYAYRQMNHNKRLIISSHAPGIVNGLENYMDSIYVAVPGTSNDGITQFAKLNEKGKQKIKDAISKIRSRTGDYVFQRFTEEGLQDENKELLDIKQ